MVNTRIVSRFTGDLPVSEFNRKIAAGPLYPEEDVLSLLNSDAESIIAWTQKCISDVQKWSLDDSDLHELVKLAVTGGRFMGSEWCKQKPGGPWAACDAYVVIRSEWVQTARREMDIEYYIKFAVGKTGAILLLISCHPYELRR